MNLPITPATNFVLAPASARESASGKAKLAEVSQQFEAIFVRQMLAEARKSHFGGEDLLGGQGMDTFRQMQDEHFADIAAERGSFGLAKMIEAQIGAKLGGEPSTSSGRAGVETASNTAPAHAEPVEAHAQHLPKEP